MQCVLFCTKLSVIFSHCQGYLFICVLLIGERERANLIVQRARFFWYIYIYIYIYIYHGQCHTANRLRVSKLTQLTIFHRSSPRVCIGTVIVLAVVHLLQSKMRQTRRAVSRPLLAVLLLRAPKPIETAGENTCSQKRASCLGNSQREREAFSSMLSAARSTREARYEQMCHLLSHQRRLEAETPAMRRGKHV